MKYLLLVITAVLLAFQSYTQSSNIEIAQGPLRTNEPNMWLATLPGAIDVLNYYIAIFKNGNGFIEKPKLHPVIDVLPLQNVAPWDNAPVQLENRIP